MSGDSLMNEALKKSQGSSSRLASLFGGGPKYEDAADLFIKAGNTFKLDKQYEKAADAYCEAAAMYNKMGDRYDEGQALMKAAEMVVKTDVKKAGPLYDQAAGIMKENGKFDMAGRTIEAYAENLYSKKDGAAMDYYLKAANYYEAAEYGKSKYTTCINKWADLASMQGSQHYEAALEVYEDTGTKALANNLLQYSAPKYFMKAVILQLVKGDPITAEVAIDKYSALDSRFARSREADLLKKATECVESGDLDAFEFALGEYDSISRFEPWHNHFWNLMQRYMTPKKKVDAAGGAFSGGVQDSDSDLC